MNVRRPSVPQRRPVTMREVAAAAGVSSATVSRVLNGTKHVDEPTATLVREAAARMAFRPSRSAQLLARPRSRLIGLVISDLLNETLLTWSRAAASQAEELGYQTVLCDGRTSPEVEARQLEHLLASRVDAILLVGPVTVPPTLRDQIVDAGIVLTPEFMHVSADSMRMRRRAEGPATAAAVDALAGGGARWIATVAAPLDDFGERVFTARRAAITTRARRHGIDVERGDHVPASRAALDHLLARHPEPGGIVALNHDLPGSIVAGVLAAGRAIPEDVAIVAFGDSRASRTWSPAVSVITRDMDREARRHVEQVIARCEGDETAAPAGMEPAVFVRRETTR